MVKIEFPEIEGSAMCSKTKLEFTSKLASWKEGFLDELKLYCTINGDLYPLTKNHQFVMNLGMGS